LSRSRRFGSGFPEPPSEPSGKRNSCTKATRSTLVVEVPHQLARRARWLPGLWSSGGLPFDRLEQFSALRSTGVPANTARTGETRSQSATAAHDSMKSQVNSGAELSDTVTIGGPVHAHTPKVVVSNPNPPPRKCRSGPVVSTRPSALRTSKVPACQRLLSAALIRHVNMSRERGHAVEESPQRSAEPAIRPIRRSRRGC